MRAFRSGIVHKIEASRWRVRCHWFDFYLLAFGAFGCFELVQDAMQLAAN
jgi:hypothetical protein